MKKYIAPNADALVLMTNDVIAGSFNVIEGDADFAAKTHEISSDYFAK